MVDREQLVQKARLAEQAERYDDMAAAMKASILGTEQGNKTYKIQKTHRQEYSTIQASHVTAERSCKIKKQLSGSFGPLTPIRSEQGPVKLVQGAERYNVQPTVGLGKKTAEDGNSNLFIVNGP
ncbi:14-3-3 protein gamma-B [Acipenser ruthenus]|uniref:14-3-3 protein gamma-B n=1 Tax=Acipenser ruthenus TaxID=7906 RepID=A0A444V1S8_ACIRT|nr:14-3-3 protein gamma-B [Acipenser ruthenus]